MSKSSVFSALLAVAFGGTAVYFAGAGPIVPPAGPVGGTYKTLAEVEPRIAVNAANTPGNASAMFVISQPGSYYLTSNIVGESGKAGISIANHHVTLNLNGFKVRGVPGSLHGISCVNKEAVVVRNGHVTEWGDCGVSLGSGSYEGGMVEGITATDNATFGIITIGNTTARDCVAGRNGEYGIWTGPNCVVSNCTAFDNLKGGIDVGNGSVVSDCTVTGNAGGPGINAGGACHVSDCTTQANAGAGIATTTTSLVTRCVSYQNNGDGIRVQANCRVFENTCHGNGNGVADGAGVHATGSDNRIEANSCVSNDRGVDVDASGNLIFRNSCSGNATNWTISANNVCNVLLAATAGSAIQGNSGGTAPGANDPTANYTY